MKRLALAAWLALVVAGCCRNGPPSVITIAVPYVSTIMLTDTSEHALGRSGCEKGGQPIRYLNKSVPEYYVPWVLLHEDVHIEQSRAYPGGCFAFAIRYNSDESFRLKAEADAFCTVYEAQIQVGLPPLPDLERIAKTLMSRSASGYEGNWSVEDARKAMRCWREP